MLSHVKIKFLILLLTATIVGSLSGGLYYVFHHHKPDFKENIFLIRDAVVEHDWETAEEKINDINLRMRWGFYLAAIEHEEEEMELLLNLIKQLQYYVELKADREALAIIYEIINIANGTWLF